MALLNFGSKDTADVEISPQVESFLRDYSIEVMPRTAEKIADFRELLPAATRVYIAHIEGTPIEDMVATAKRIAGEGFTVMPHFPARIIKDPHNHPLATTPIAFHTNGSQRCTSPPA